MASSNGRKALSGRVGAAILDAMTGSRSRQQGENNRENNSLAYERTCARTGLVTYQNNLELGESVVLLNGNNDCVAKGIVAVVKVGKLLSGPRLHSSEVGILLTTIYKLSFSIVEPFMHTLGEILAIYNKMASTSCMRNTTTVARHSSRSRHKHTKLQTIHLGLILE